MMEPHVLKELGRKDGVRYKSIADVQNAKNGSNFWSERNKLLLQQINRIAKLGFSMLFLSHLKVKKWNKVPPHKMPFEIMALWRPFLNMIRYKSDRRYLKGSEII